MKENKKTHSFEVLAFPLIIYIQEKQNEQKWKNNIKKERFWETKGAEQIWRYSEEKVIFITGKTRGRISGRIRSLCGLCKWFSNNWDTYPSTYWRSSFCFGATASRFLSYTISSNSSIPASSLLSSLTPCSFFDSAKPDTIKVFPWNTT